MTRSSILAICRRAHARTIYNIPSQRFSTATRYRADEARENASETIAETPSSTFNASPSETPSAAPLDATPAGPRASARIEQLARNARGEAATRPSAGTSADEPYHINVYSHKHNCHVTFTEPSRDVILSYSCGNLGLRKGQRGSYDAAYQLAAYTCRKIAEKNWKIGGKKGTGVPITLNDATIHKRGIELVLRGFGTGREAFQKAILGAEGRLIKPLVKRVTDSTRLKFGGTRSRAQRRLG